MHWLVLWPASPGLPQAVTLSWQVALLSRVSLSTWCFLTGSLCHGCLRATFQEGELGDLGSRTYLLSLMLHSIGGGKLEGRKWGRRVLTPCLLPVPTPISNSSQTSRKGLEIDHLKAGFFSQQCCKGSRFYLPTLSPLWELSLHLHACHLMVARWLLQLQTSWLHQWLKAER